MRRPNPSDVAAGQPERRDLRSRELLLQRVRAEFTEMPGLRLTLAQARRLFALRTDICERVLNTLAAAGVVVRAPDGRYSRRDAAA